MHMELVLQISEIVTAYNNGAIGVIMDGVKDKMSLSSTKKSMGRI